MFAIPGEQTVHAGSACPLRLELDAPLPPLVAGTKVTIPFVVRNITNRAVESCTVDGVSIRIRSDAEAQWRLVLLQGFTTDVDCSHTLRLGPGETEDFAREIAIFTNLPPGGVTLHAILGFDRAAFNRECGEALEWTQMATIIKPESR
jgi:hypothetical protein